VKAVILCGGMGTRLREHTELRPKPMVEVGGIPILVHIMRMYARHNIREFVLCLGYKADVVKQYFLNFDAMQNDLTIELGKHNSIKFHDRHRDDWSVTLSDTGASTNTGARIKKIARYLDGETFAVTYGDGVADLDLATVAEFHRSHGKKATVTGVRPPSRFGEIEHVRGRVTSFNEKPQATQGLINGGFFFFEPSFLDYIGDDDALEREPLERCVADGELQVYEHAGFWHCMDTYRDWEHLDQWWRAGTAPWK
jgi:glucose-1-phosphate cytidylyltransferase